MVHITLVGDLEGYGTLWFHPEVIAKILYLVQVNNIYRVTHDSSKGNCFTVQKRNSVTRKLVDLPQGLYWINNKDSDGAGGTTIINIEDNYNIQVITYTDTSLINMVEDKRSRYTCLYYLRVKLVRKVHQIVVRHSTEDYKIYAANNSMIYCTISLYDVNAAGDIFGKYKGYLSGKTTPSKPHLCIVHIHQHPQATHGKLPISHFIH